MNWEEYISSGVIEAYVLGVATPEEAGEVVRMMEQYPQVKDAVQEQEALLASYARTHAVTPPPQLKQTIWETIQKSEAMDEAEPVFIPVAPDTDIRPLSYRLRDYAMAAAIILLVASGIGNIWMMDRNKKMKADMEAMLAIQQSLVHKKNNAEMMAQKANDALGVMKLPTLKKINLAGVGTHTAHSGMLYWDGATGDVFLDLSSMPQAPEGKQYQLWAIVDGKPVDAGMYDAGSAEMMHKMKTIARAEMFAITIERAGGSPVPTLDQMVVAGKAS